MGPSNSRPALIAERAKGLRNGESRAMNAVIRQFGLKQKYTTQELEKPFVILRVVFQPDMTDANQARMVMERAMAGTTRPAALPRATEDATTARRRRPRTIEPPPVDALVAVVPSETVIGREYEIKRTHRGELTCMCQAFTFSPRTCKHIAKLGA